MWEVFKDSSGCPLFWRIYNLCGGSLLPSTKRCVVCCVNTINADVFILICRLERVKYIVPIVLLSAVNHSANRFVNSNLTTNAIEKFSADNGIRTRDLSDGRLTLLPLYNRASLISYVIAAIISVKSAYFSLLNFLQHTIYFLPTHQAPSSLYTHCIY